MNRANRLIHALTVSKVAGKFFSEVYSPVPNHPTGIPFNILLTYFYMRPNHNKAGEHIEIMKAHRDLVGNSLIIIDSGVFTFFSTFGVNTAVHIQANKNIINKGMSQLKEIRLYTTDYAQFLRDTSQYWDIAVDFDADSFLEESTVDEIHEDIISIANVDRSRFMRVYHHERPNSREWWRNISKDPRYLHLGIGSGTRRDWQFYTYMADFAHKHNKKVHAFGLGSPRFLESAPVDTADTTSHLAGGKFGRVYTPIGIISFANTSDKDVLNRYDNLRKETQEWLRDLWKSKYGITVEQLKESPYVRNTLNIWYMNEFWDVPYVENQKTLPLFDMMGV